jgi:hypothetical protein
MADYAWSNFQADWSEEERRFTKRIKPGDTISQADLDVDDDEWETLKAIGSVRQQPYPAAVADGSYTDSPQRYYMDLLQKAGEGTMTDEESKTLAAMSDPGGTGAPAPAEGEAAAVVEEKASATTASARK